MSDINSPYSNIPNNTGDNPTYILLDPGASQTTKQLIADSHHSIAQFQESSSTDSVSASMVGGSINKSRSKSRSKSRLNEIRFTTNRKDAPEIAAKLFLNKLHYKNTDFVFQINNKTYKATKRNGKLHGKVKEIKLTKK